MATKFSDFMRGIEEQAQAEGPEAVAELQTFRDHFRLGRELAEARLAMGLTQKDVAKKAKVNQSEVSDIERGRSNPTYDTLSRVAMAVDKRFGLVDVPRKRKRG